MFSAAELHDKLQLTSSTVLRVQLHLWHQCGKSSGIQPRRPQLPQRWTHERRYRSSTNEQSIKLPHDGTSTKAMHRSRHAHYSQIPFLSSQPDHGIRRVAAPTPATYLRGCAGRRRRAARQGAAAPRRRRRGPGGRRCGGHA